MTISVLLFACREVVVPYNFGTVTRPRICRKQPQFYAIRSRTKDPVFEHKILLKFVSDFL